MRKLSIILVVLCFLQITNAIGEDGFFEHYDLVEFSINKSGLSIEDNKYFNIINEQYDPSQVVFDPDLLFRKNEGIFLRPSRGLTTFELNRNLPSSFGVEFKIVLNEMGNAGNIQRPIFQIGLEPLRNDSNHSYFIKYHLETMQVEPGIVANLYRTKWTLVDSYQGDNIVLDEGFFLMTEDVEYTIGVNLEKSDHNLSITLNGDGPDKNKHKEILSYEEQDDQSSKGYMLSFGSSGRRNDVWGHPPKIIFKDIKIMSNGKYNKRQELKDNNNNNNTFEGYLYRNRIIDKNFSKITYKYFLNSLIQYKLGPLDSSCLKESKEFKKYQKKVDIYFENFQRKLKQPITRYDAAQIIYKMLDSPQFDSRYSGLIKDNNDITRYRAVNYAFQNNYFNLDSDNNFRGSDLLTQDNFKKILSRLLKNPSEKNQELRLAGVFQDNMVLQRDKPVKIWGYGMDGDTVEVELADQLQKTVVVDGKWQVVLDPVKAGGPYLLKVSDYTNSIYIDNVFFGDVFIIAGQSNAEWPLNRCSNYEEFIRKHRNTDKFRYYIHDYIYASSTNNDLEGKWEKGLDWVLDFTPGLTNFIAERLSEDSELKDVKLGFIPMAYGGSTIEVLMPNSKNHLQADDRYIESGFWKGFFDYIAPYPVKAVVYYQGENSTQLGYSYECLLREYIKKFRNEFNDSDLPFYLIQLAAYGSNYYETDSDTWPVIREIQHRVANTTNNTYLISALDLADEDPLEIHPKDKKTLGRRVGDYILQHSYNKNLNRLHPTLKNFSLGENGYIIEFNNVYDELMLVNDEGEFEVLVANQGWKKVKASLTDNPNMILVNVEDASEVKGVRYGWRNYPKISLYDKSGYSVLPFNTTKNLNYIPKCPKSDEFNLFIPNHFTFNWDAIVNLDRGDTFRAVERINANQLHHKYSIKGQKPGDRILILHRLGRVKANNGTTSEIININNHRLNMGDYVRNNTRLWKERRVLEVIDKDTIRVKPISGQCQGDELELYTRYREFISK